jgi:hypothetical protein
MYSRSFATISTGKYVSGTAAAPSTTDTSVTVIGSTVVRMNAVAAMMLARQMTWKRGACAGRCDLHHVQPKNWLTM